MQKAIAIAIILMLTASSVLVTSKTALGQTVPSVPEFTVNLETSRAIEVTIKNQPLAPTANSDGQNVSLYYNVRIKLNADQNWTTLYLTEDMPHQSNGDYTSLFYPLVNENVGEYDLGDRAMEFPNGASIDFQVKAMMGYIHRVFNPNATDQLSMYPYVFTGTESGWSQTQTLEMPSQTPQPPYWAIQTLDPTTPDLNGYCPIAIDSKGNPHIAYTDTLLGVMYTSWNGSAWNAQNVTGGKVFDFALDSNGTPHILFEANGIMYARWSGSQWKLQAVDRNVSQFGLFASLALDTADNPHVAYTDENKIIKCASLTGTSWSIESVATVLSDYAPRVAVTVDKNNTAYVLYGSQSNATLAVRTSDSSWTLQTVVSDIVSLGNLVLDSHGDPQFVFLRNYIPNSVPQVYGLWYASWDGTRWNTELIATNTAASGLGGRTGFYTFAYLAMDSDDFPHIAYVTSLPNDASGWGYLAYASKINNNWEIETVNSTVISGNCYLAEDQNDDAHIAFVGVVPNGSQTYQAIGAYSWTAPLMYAEYVRPTSVSQALTPLPTVPEFPSWIAAAILIITFVVSVAVPKRKRQPL